VAACNKLYVIGGNECPRSILSLHRTEPGARWKQVGSTIDERCDAKATLHNGTMCWYLQRLKLYLWLCCNSVFLLRTVYLACFRMGEFMLLGLIYIVGGNTTSVECFDPAGDVPHCVKTASVSHAYCPLAITDYCGKFAFVSFVVNAWRTL